MTAAPFFHRQPAPVRRAFWRGFATVILWALIILGAVLFTGCETALYDPGSGRKVASFRSDIVQGDYSAGATRFTFAKMSNSVPTRAALLGANKIVGTVASAAVAAMVPGSGVTAVVSKTAISAVPHITSGTAAPSDKTPAQLWPITQP